jgi:hypothetical protein
MARSNTDTFLKERNMKMKIAVKMLAVLSSVMLCASVATAARPPGPAKCYEMPAETIMELNILCDHTENSSLGNVPPYDFLKQHARDGLVGKVVAASFKMAQGKPCDADQKLYNYRTTLSMLMLTAGGPKAKISGSKGDQLHTDLNAAQAAIAPLPCL